MSDDQSYESLQHVTDEHYRFDFRFSDHDDITNSGIMFAKLRTEVDSDEEISLKTWPLQEVWLELMICWGLKNQ